MFHSEFNNQINQPQQTKQLQRFFGGYISVNDLYKFIFEQGSLGRLPIVGEYVNVFIDLNNAFSGLFYDDAMVKFHQESKQNEVNFEMIINLIQFIEFTRTNIKKKMNMNTRFILFKETGKSVYHTNIHKGYKANRQVKTTVLPEEVCKSARQVIKLNYRIIDQLSKLIPDVYYVELRHLEADFIPHYFIKNGILQDNTFVNIIRSSDHDMYQTVSQFNNCIMYFKITSQYRRENIILHNTNLMKYACRNYSIAKKPIEMEELSSQHWKNIYIHALMGDGGDDVPGIKGVGYMTGLKILNGVMDVLELNRTDIQLLFKNMNLFQYFEDCPKDNWEYIANKLKPMQIGDEIVAIFHKFYKHMTIGKKPNPHVKKMIEHYDTIYKAHYLTSFDRLCEYFENLGVNQKNLQEQKEELLLKVQNNNKDVDKEVFDQILTESLKIGDYFPNYNTGGIFYA